MMISFRGLLLLLSREFFIFQIADVHLLHSATWWRLLGQKYSLTAEVTRLRLRGERVAVWCGNEIEPHYGRVAQTTGSQTKRERSPFAARSSRKIGPKCCTLVRFRAAAIGDRSRSGTWATRPYAGYLVTGLEAEPNPRISAFGFRGSTGNLRS